MREGEGRKKGKRRRGNRGERKRERESKKDEERKQVNKLAQTKINEKKQKQNQTWQGEIKEPKKQNAGLERQRKGGCRKDRLRASQNGSHIRLSLKTQVEPPVRNLSALCPVF